MLSSNSLICLSLRKYAGVLITEKFSVLQLRRISPQVSFCIFNFSWLMHIVYMLMILKFSNCEKFLILVVIPWNLGIM